MFKFIHAADIHLDSPLRGLAQYEGAPAGRIRGATREALKNLVRTAVDEAVAFVVIAGDTFDGDWRDYNTGLFFAQQMSLLRREGIRVFMVSGNHDAASVISRSLKMPDNVYQFSDRKPESVPLPEIRAAVHGRGFPRPDVSEDLSAAYPPPSDGCYNVGLLHTCAEGSPAHAPYAPCRIADLCRKGYDYWALGHVHRYEVLSASPWVVFPGNIQGRHIRETGPKGCVLVTVDDDRRSSLEHLALDVVRWERLSVDCSADASPEAVVRSVRRVLREAVGSAAHRLLAVRIEIGGGSDALSALSIEREKWVNQIRMEATDLSREGAWVEKVVIACQPSADPGMIENAPGPIADLLAFIRHAATDPATLAELGGGLEDLAAKLPAELTGEEGAFDLRDPALLAELVQSVPDVLIPRLSSGGGEQ